MAARAASSKKKRSSGFRQAGALVGAQIRKAGETRGFAVTRVLTHWEEIVGTDVAQICRPVEVGYGRGGMGATLVLLTTGSQAPILQMQEERLRDRINACYGYAAISRIRITQTAPVGFAEGATPFTGPRDAPPAAPAPAHVEQATDWAADVGDDGLRRALETLGTNVLTRSARPARCKTERQT
ncbi:MAG: DUF721 domain-containing protein [Pseudomonadota bacterium]